MPIVVNITYKKISDGLLPYKKEKKSSYTKFAKDMVGSAFSFFNANSNPENKLDPHIQALKNFSEKILLSKSDDELLDPHELHRLYFILRDYNNAGNVDLSVARSYMEIFCAFNNVHEDFLELLFKLQDYGMIGRLVDLEENDFVMLPNNVDVDVDKDGDSLDDQQARIGQHFSGIENFRKIVTHDYIKILLDLIHKMFFLKWPREEFNKVFIWLLDCHDLKLFKKNLHDNVSQIDKYKSKFWLKELKLIQPEKKFNPLSDALSDSGSFLSNDSSLNRIIKLVAENGIDIGSTPNLSDCESGDSDREVHDEPMPEITRVTSHEQKQQILEQQILAEEQHKNISNINPELDEAKSDTEVATSDDMCELQYIPGLFEDKNHKVESPRPNLIDCHEAKKTPVFF